MVVDEILNGLDIEPKILPLVKTLNKIHYIKTLESCEGHYFLQDTNQHRAYVLFRVQKTHEHEFKNMVHRILKDYEPLQPDFLLYFSIYIKVDPNDKKLEEDWRIKIEPTPGHIDPDEKRRLTDKGIEYLVNFISKQE